MPGKRRTALVLLLAFCCCFLLPVTVKADVVEVSAESYVLMDADSGKILLAKNEDKRLPPASMTKIMTLILALEDLQEGKVGLKDKVIASENAWKMGGSQVYLEPGEEMTFEDMLIAIAVGSANDACVAVAEHLEGTHQNFVQRMNEKAKSMGLKNTNFINAYGLTAEGHYSSALDMAIMARYALEVPKMLEYTSIKEYNLRQGEFKLFNTNKLLWWFEGTDGFKTGWTDEAKYCLTSTVKRDDLRLIAVVMASPVAQSHFRDSMQLFNYGFAKYSFKSFFAPGSTCGTVQVGKGAQDQVEVVAGENAGVICAKGEEKKISYKKSLSDYIDAPVKAGQKLGELMIYQDQELLKKVNLNAAQDIERGGLLRQFLKMIAETYLL